MVTRLRGSGSQCLFSASWKGSGCQVGLDTVTVAGWKYLVIVIFFLLKIGNSGLHSFSAWAAREVEKQKGTLYTKGL